MRTHGSSSVGTTFPGSFGLIELLGNASAPDETVLFVQGDLFLGDEAPEIFGATGEIALSNARIELEDGELEIAPTGKISGTGRIDAFGVSAISNFGEIGCGVAINGNVIFAGTPVVACAAASGSPGAPLLNPLAASPFARAARRRPEPPPPFPGPFVVNGDATLAGRFVLQFMNGFAPRAGDAFELLQVSGTVTGSFDDVAVRGLAPGFEFAADPLGGRLVLTALSDGVALPSVSLKAKPRLKEKKKKGAKLKLSRAGDTSQALAVRYLIRGSARNGIDYELLPDVVEIPAGKKSAKLLLRPIADGLAEGAETIELEVLPGESYTPSLAARAEIELQDPKEKKRRR